DQVRAYALDQLKQVAALLRQKAPNDATAFSQWLQQVAQRVASASKEGGFLGFGGTLVSEQEEAALRDIGAALGTRAACRAARCRGGRFGTGFRARPRPCVVTRRRGGGGGT